MIKGMSKRYVNIMSKISPESANELDNICRDKGFRSKYELLQYLVSSLLRFYRNKNCDEDEITEMTNLFEGSGISSHVKPGRRRYKNDARSIEVIIINGDGLSYRVLRDGEELKYKVEKIDDDVIIDYVLKKYPAIKKILHYDREINVIDIISHALSVYFDHKISDEINDEFDEYTNYQLHQNETNYKRKINKYDE